MATLNKLMTQINKTSTVFIKISKTPDQDATNQANVVEKATNGIPQSDKVHEAIEYQKPEDESQEYSADAADSENNYEYVIFDSNSDIIEETEIINTTQEDDEELQIQVSAIPIAFCHAELWSCKSCIFSITSRVQRLSKSSKSRLWISEIDGKSNRPMKTHSSKS